MRPAMSLAELDKLKEEALQADHFDGRSRDLTSWQARVRAVLVRSLGADNDLLRRFDEVRYTPVAWSEATPQSYFDHVFREGVLEALAIIDAAAYELGLAGGGETIDEHAYDPELWAHVKTLVADEAWAMVASQAAIFTENHVRIWAGGPRDRQGNNLVGKNLYLEVFGDNSDYHLGAQASEREGWRYLGMGFAQALSNVDRHRIQARGDAKRYALGVLGLASLLLTQLRYEHSGILQGPPA